MELKEDEPVTKGKAGKDKKFYFYRTNHTYYNDVIRV